MRDVRTTATGLLDRIYERTPDNERSAFLLKSMYVETIEDILQELPDYLTKEELLAFRKPASQPNCAECGVTEYFRDDYATICAGCGLVTTTQFGGIESLGYRHTIPHVYKSSYRREGHFSDFLHRLQGREKTTLPKGSVEKLQAWCKRNQIEPTKLTAQQVRTALSQMKLPRCFDFVPTLLHRVSGRPLPTIDRHVAEEMKLLFLEIQEPFEIAVQDLCPQRKNFFSYAFVTIRFMEMLGVNPSPFCLFSPKTWQKKVEQDAIWRHICRQLDFPYMPHV